MRRRTKILLWTAAAMLALVAAAGVAGLWIARSQWFAGKVRERIVYEIQNATGGRAEIGSFRFDWKTLTAEVSPLVLHGTEPAGQPPFLRVRSVRVGLRIVSALKRDVDIALLALDRPEVHITVARDGSSNIPSPKTPRQSKTTLVEDLLRLKVRRFAVTQGLVEYNDRLIPLEASGEDLNAHVVFDSAGPRYRGELSSRRVHVASQYTLPLDFDLDSAFAVEKGRVRAERIHLATKRSEADVQGVFEFPPAARGELDGRVRLSLSELGRPLRLPIAHQGTAVLDGKATFGFGGDLTYGWKGRLSARGLAYSIRDVALSGIAVDSGVDLTPKRLTLTALTLRALGGAFNGSGSVDDWKRFEVRGDVEDLTVREAARLAIARPLAWEGVIGGPAEVSGVIGPRGVHDLVAKANVLITPGTSGIPVGGHIDAVYSQQNGEVNLADSWVATSATRLDISGTPGETLRVRARSTNLHDVDPVLALFGQTPGSLPVTLQNGQAVFDGQVRGPLNDPEIAGQVSLAQFVVQDRLFNRFNGDLVVNHSQLRLRRLTLDLPALHMEGRLQVELAGWKPGDGAVAAQMNLQSSDLEKLTRETGASIPITGTASGTLRVEGTISRPRAEISVLAEKLRVYEERVDRFVANVRYAPGMVQVGSGHAEQDGARARFSGTFQYQENDWKTGRLQLQVSGEGIRLSAIRHIQELSAGLDGRLDAKVSASGRLVKGAFQPAALDSQVSVRGLVVDHRKFGDVSLSTVTKGATLEAHAGASLGKARLEGKGAWQLQGDYPGSASVQLSPVTLATLRQLGLLGSSTSELPFQGFVEGGATVSFPLLKPATLDGEVTLQTLQINPSPSRTLRLGTQAQDVALRNAKPIVLRFSSKRVRIESAQFTARDTSLEATGGVELQPKLALDLTVRGGINLAILQLLNPDLLAQGSATVHAAVGGAPDDPQVNGRMELKNASLYISDLPNGVDNANGVILFDKSRATIEKLTAQTGGGQLRFSGFIGFTGSALLYRVQAQADQVRVRYPEDVSVTLNALLNLTGTSENSLLSGVITVTRASFQPRTDLGQLLSQSARPTPAPSAPSEYLRGMQFDVRIESGPDLEVQTSLTRDLQTEAELRLRGTPLRPVLFGDVSINEGEVQVFGNRYTINRADIRFFNPVKIEPVFDVDLETKARGITVNISFSGTLNKLNVSYRSDPPLQTREIIALLAMGRAPDTTSGLASSQITSQSNFLQSGTNSLLGQAVSAQLSSRLQRFFGVSRLKIDPDLTGVENLPQARLTLEQPVSKDIRLTYITNLSRTQEQVVRVEWDLNRQWSVVAVRDVNGVFTVDFAFRRRFK